jgi:hypothetical protein
MTNQACVTRVLFLGVVAWGTSCVLVDETDYQFLYPFDDTPNYLFPMSRRSQAYISSAGRRLLETCNFPHRRILATVP